MRQPTVSHHLKTMATAGLLAREKRGTWVWYSVDRDGMRAVRDILRSPVGALI
ncbi:ArsR/SmtB family transcription factor [Streptomyces maoxianensis]|uniref:ArsR/SmtB family transcription factor n=1 Tax=Streptomyces maoxianensis TaxID=1459942 RepID=A0ABV9G1N8_9ACTN